MGRKAMPYSYICVWLGWVCEWEEGRKKEGEATKMGDCDKRADLCTAQHPLKTAAALRWLCVVVVCLSVCLCFDEQLKLSPWIKQTRISRFFWKKKKKKKHMERKNNDEWRMKKTNEWMTNDEWRMCVCPVLDLDLALAPALPCPTNSGSSY